MSMVEPANSGHPCDSLVKCLIVCILLYAAGGTHSVLIKGDIVFSGVSLKMGSAVHTNISREGSTFRCNHLVLVREVNLWSQQCNLQVVVDVATEENKSVNQRGFT